MLMIRFPWKKRDAHWSGCSGCNSQKIFKSRDKNNSVGIAVGEL